MELSLSWDLEKTQGNNGVASQNSRIHNPSKSIESSLIDFFVPVV